MKHSIDTIRVSDKGKDLLAKIKRTTGIPTWNVICRMAFCLSLRDKSTPPPASEGDKPAIEIAWKIFGGENAEIYKALLLKRYSNERATNPNLSLEECLKRHIFRGLGSLDAATNQRNQTNIYRFFSSVIAS
jgi:DNA sulfur modification protein DndE